MGVGGEGHGRREGSELRILGVLCEVGGLQVRRLSENERSSETSKREGEATKGTATTGERALVATCWTLPTALARCRTG